MQDITVEIPYHFDPREYQREALWEIRKAIRKESQKRFFYLIWHRRAGKDKSLIADAIPRKLIHDVSLVRMVYPTLVMARENLWDGIGKDGFRFRDHIPREIRQGTPNEGLMKIPIINGSLFQLGGSNYPDSLRGGNPQMLVFSEWAEQDPYVWDVVEPILRENDGIAIFNTTPKGNNHARALYDFARDHKEWYVQTLTVADTHIYTPEKINEIRMDTIKRFAANGRSEEEAIAYINQEYYCSFDAPVMGSYYGIGIQKAEAEGRIGRVPYMVGVPVETAWDLGIDDSMTVWFFQVVGMEFHFIDYYENSGEGFEHYAQVLQEKKYLYGKHYAPHDIEQRELGTGKSRREIAKRLGIDFQIGPNLGIDEGINAARTVFSRCWFDAEKCFRGLSSLKNYKKDWDEKNMVYRKGPLHNWASHGADGFRTFAVGFREAIRRSTVQPDVGGISGASGIPGLL